MALFIEHAQRTHNEDSLLAYLALVHYRNTADESLRVLLGAQIAMDYLKDGSEFEINVSGPLKATAAYAVVHQRPLPANLFAGIEKEVVALIRTNLWLSYQNTRGYLMSGVILDVSKNASQGFSGGSSQHKQLDSKPT
jgi:hypothetical protein